jgi:hypothetical protein
MPRSRALHERIKDRMDGKEEPKKLEGKGKVGTNDKAGDPSILTVKELVRRLSPKVRMALYDELVSVMQSEDEYEEEDEE